MTNQLTQKPPDFSGGLAACQDVSDFTRSAALIFIYGYFNKTLFQVLNYDIKLKH